MALDPALATASDPAAAEAPARQALLDFDIPGQPLASALERYAVLADQTVLFSDALVQGRMSTPVKGLYVPQAALATLLTGTGLMADGRDGQLKGAFVLRRLSDAVPAAAAEPGLDRRYDGLVQARVWEALCADSRTEPGSYRASLRLNIDPAGRLTEPRLLASTGDVARDRAMLAALSGLALDQSPPMDLRQPLMLVILPRDRLAGRACGKRAAP
ncbi:STN domain-containing protein [Variovorax sp. RB2P76]|uniref:STN domain-containing protein n=1 Tax=Variovorax sp. RB2P76 TaxID=3443736 RepID=UPI003F4707D5